MLTHGVGKFGGLQTIEVGGHMQEAIKLVYQDRDLPLCEHSQLA